MNQAVRYTSNIETFQDLHKINIKVGLNEFDEMKMYV